MDTELIRDTIAEIEPTEEKVDEIYKKLLVKKRGLEKMEKRKANSVRLKKLVPLVAALTIIISTTAAFAYMGVDSIFLKYLNEKNIVNETLIGDIGVDGYIHNLNKEIANENGVLYIKQAIMDKDTLFIYTRFEGKEGIDFTGEDRSYSFKEDVYNKQWFSEDKAERDKLMDEYRKIQDERLLKVVEQGSTVSIHGVELDFDSRIIGVDKNKMDFVLSLDVGERLEEIKHGEISFHFKDFGYYQEYQETLSDGEVINIVSDKFVPLVKGEWKGNIKLEGKLLPTKTYKIDKEINFSVKDGRDAKIKIKDLEVSNISFRMNVEYEQEKDEVVMTLISEKRAKGGDIVLKQKNGEITEAVINSLVATGTEDNGMLKETMKRSFDSPINLEELQSIIVWGEEIVLK